MVGQFIDMVYVHLMRSTSQEEAMAVKSAFELWEDTFGVKIKRYHEYNRIFSKQPPRGAVEETNQKINFFGVGSHGQNSIDKPKIITLMLGYMTLLRHT